MMLKFICWFIFSVVLLSFCASVAAGVKGIKLQVFTPFDAERPYCKSYPPQIEIDVSQDAFQFHINHGPTESNKVGRCRIQPLALPQQVNYTDVIFEKVKNVPGYVSDIFNKSTLREGWYDNECVFHLDYAKCAEYNGSECIVTPGKIVDKGVKCVTKLYILNTGYQKTSGRLSANNKMFYPSTESQEYTFYDGEGTNFTCHEDVGNAVDVVLTYKLYRVIRITNNQKKQTSPLSIYVKLGADDDGETLECTFFYKDHEQVVRVKLTVDKDMRGILAFAVNGLILPLITDNYCEYKFCSGEAITVNLIKDSETYGEETCSAGGQVVPTTKQSNRLSSILLLSQIISSGRELYCTVFRILDGQRFDIRLKFSWQTYDYNPFIVGLSISNIYLQYSNTNENAIVYNIGSEQLTLVCSFYASGNAVEGTWNYSNVEVTSEYINHYRSFQLQYGHNKTTVQCIDNSSYKTTRLILIRANDAGPTTSAQTTTTLSTTTTSTTRRPTPVPVTQATTTRSTTTHTTRSTTTHTTRSTTTHTTSSTTSLQDPSTTPRPEHQPTEGMWLIVISVVLVIFLLMLGLWIGYIYKKKRMPLNNTSNMDYQTLPDHHEGPMATPSQWNRQDGVTYADPNSFHNLYAKPIPKGKRNKTEPTYLNTQPMNNEPAYASVQHNDPTYAFVAHNDPTYASVQHDEPAYASVQHNEPAYASVQHSDPTYASVQHSDPTYASVQHNEPAYASVQHNEPGYASVQHNVPTSKSAQNNEPTYSNQILNEYQNTKTLNGANNKNTSLVGNKSKDSDRPSSFDLKNRKQSLDGDGQNSKNIKNAHDVNSKPAQMADTYVNLLKELKDKKHGYVNVDVKNDVEPAYCEVLQSKK